jgi:long-chain fatty acid transport protein
MNKIFKLISVLSLSFLLTTGLNANGLNLNGVGSKSISMGGAFIGLADDFSAAYWNPAGLVQMKEANLSAFGTFIYPKASYEFRLLGINAENESKVYPSGSFGYFKPLSEKVVAGVLVYVPSGIGLRWNGDDLKLLAGGASYKWDSMVGVVTVAPTIAFKLSDQFSIGAALNINYGLLKVSKPGLGQYEEDLNGIAFGATFGAMFKPAKMLSIGVCFRTPFKAKLKGDSTMALAGIFGLPDMVTLEREATFPMFFGAGIAFHASRKMTITADVQYTNWEKLDSIPATFDNPGWDLFFGPGAELDLRWEDATQLRFGLQYQLSEAFALRAGYYTDPAPGPLSTQNILIPGFDYNTFTIGFGYNTSKVNIDFAFEYVKGKERVVGLLDAIPDVGMPGVHNLKVFVPTFSVTFFL